MVERNVVQITWGAGGSTATVSAWVVSDDGEPSGTLVEPPAPFDAPIVALAIAHHLDAFPTLF